MSLSTAFDTAKSSLAASQQQTAIIARNIANVNTVGATRKYANVVTGPTGQVQVKSVTQSSNYALFRNMLDASAAVGKGNVISNGLDRLSETLGDTELSRSPASMISKLSDAMNTLSASPNNYELARNAATAAADLVQTINDASITAQTIRKDADNELVNAAAQMNKLLASIEILNKEVIAGTRTGADVTDISDQRDQAVAALSQYVGVSIVMRGENDMVLYTDSGVTLFETTARAVEFTATPGLNETVTEGNALRIDGTAVTGSTAYMPLKSGSVAGLVALRDDVLVTYQTQLDEMARGLVEAFTEKQAGSPTIMGLFKADTATLNPDGTIATGLVGLAGSLRLADGVTTNPTKLRDGITYDYNTTDLGGFTGRLNELSTAMAATRSFSSLAGADPSGSIADFAASSVSWLQATRQTSLTETEYKTTLLERTQDTLSNETGINMDEQLTQMLQFERSFQASSKLISTIDEMLQTLLNSI
jgi:flagellar hook-associated protein 1 FlgK